MNPQLLPACLLPCPNAHIIFFQSSWTHQSMVWCNSIVPVLEKSSKYLMREDQTHRPGQQTRHSLPRSTGAGSSNCASDKLPRSAPQQGPEPAEKGSRSPGKTQQTLCFLELGTAACKPPQRLALRTAGAPWPQLPFIAPQSCVIPASCYFGLKKLLETP